MATQEFHLRALATRVANYLRDSIVPRLLPTGGTAGQVLAKVNATNYNVGWVSPGSGGADPWARTTLAADFTNATVTFATITGLSYTPPPNVNFTLEAEILIQTTTIANLPRVGVSVAASATGGYGGIDIDGPVATAAGTAPQSANAGYTNNAAAVVAQMAIGGVAVANVPYIVKVVVKGKSGAAPGAITLQMAAETAGANICFVKAGSEMRVRSGY